MAEEIATDAAPTSGWEVWAKKATTARDMVLVGAGLVYVLGFFIWAYNAYSRNLGLVSVSQVQYGAAGLIPIVLGLYGFLVARIGAVMNPHVVGAWTIIKHCLRSFFICAVLWGVSIFAAIFLLPGNNLPFKVASSIVTVTFIGLFVGKAYVLRDKDEDDLPWWQQTSWWLTLCIPSYIAVSMYAQLVYPAIPQEFGGMAPRSALIEVKRIDLSPRQRGVLLSAADQIGPKDPSKDANPVVTSIPVEVLYDNGDVIELRPQGSRSSAVFEIKRSNIVSITWLGYDIANNGKP
ncbi:hypothetical protein [Capsulimonas corticalis]|nr:hypothetical protein [Capsulimonas corticalis]